MRGEINKMENHSILKRYSLPTKYDEAPYGTQCRVDSKNDTFDLYVQINHEDNNPRWMLIGNYSSNSDEDFILIEIKNKSNVKFN